MALRYQPRQSPDLSPPVSRIADRHGSKANSIRTSVRPADPGRSSLRLPIDEPTIESTKGRPSAGPTSASRVDRVHYLRPCPHIKRSDPAQQVVGDPDLPFLDRHSVANPLPDDAHRLGCLRQGRELEAVN